MPADARFRRCFHAAFIDDALPPLFRASFDSQRFLPRRLSFAITMRCCAFAMVPPRCHYVYYVSRHFPLDAMIFSLIFAAQRLRACAMLRADAMLPIISTIRALPPR